MDTKFQRLARRQLSQVVGAYLRPATTTKAPRDGWITAIREALGMSAQDLGKRMGVGTSSVFRLEDRERDGRATIAALRAGAEALGFDLVYALVPRIERPTTAVDDTILDELIMSAAMGVAAEDLRRVGKTMALEDQAVARGAADAQLKERATELAANPRELWRRAGGRSPARSRK